MNKIPTLFVRDPENRKYVIDEITPGCEWVLAGEGRATRKWDGTCVLYDAGTHRWMARREIKPRGSWPEGFVPEVHDPVTSKTMGWEPIENSSFYKFFQEAVGEREWVQGTYELVGPKINGNPEMLSKHMLVPHGNEVFDDKVTSFEDARDLMRGLRTLGFEGVVWWHPDGRKAKLKVRDFKWDG